MNTRACIDCGIIIEVRCAVKRCKPCAGTHYLNYQNQRKKAARPPRERISAIEAVYSFIRDAGQCSTKDINQATGAHRDTVRQSLARLIAQDKIKRIGYGTYAPKDGDKPRIPMPISAAILAPAPFIRQLTEAEKMRGKA